MEDLFLNKLSFIIRLYIEFKFIESILNFYLIMFIILLFILNI